MSGLTNDGLCQLKIELQKITGRINKILPDLHQLLLDISSIEKIYDGMESTIRSSYTPTTKDNKGDPLAELLHNLSEADKAKLVVGLEQKLGEK